MQTLSGDLIVIASLIAGLFLGEKIAIYRQRRARARRAGRQALRLAALREEQQLRDHTLSVLLGSTCTCDRCTADQTSRNHA